MRRKLYWAGVLAGVLLLAAGIAVSALGASATATPAVVVRGYFAALARGDAPAALAYGTVPPGPHALLTSAVLQEQQRIAPLRNVSVGSISEHGSKATVEVTYELAFPARTVSESVRIALHKASGDWRLNRVSVPIDLQPTGGRQRESILRARLPTGTTLVFPGALPIRLDTPYLELDPPRDTVRFDVPGTMGVYLRVSDAGRAAMVRAVGAALRRCLTRGDDPGCPLPSERYVPGTIRGVVKGGLRPADVLLQNLDPIGTLRYSGAVTVSGTWQRLNFHNQRVTGHGRIDLDLDAQAYAVPPLRVHWRTP